MKKISLTVSGCMLPVKSFVMWRPVDIWPFSWRDGSSNQRNLLFLFNIFQISFNDLIFFLSFKFIPTIRKQVLCLSGLPRCIYLLSPGQLNTELVIGKDNSLWGDVFIRPDLTDPYSSVIRSWDIFIVHFKQKGNSIPWDGGSHAACWFSYI